MTRLDDLRKALQVAAFCEAQARDSSRYLQLLKQVPRVRVRVHHVRARVESASCPVAFRRTFRFKNLPME